MSMFGNYFKDTVADAIKDACQATYGEEPYNMDKADKCKALTEILEVLSYLFEE